MASIGKGRRYQYEAGAAMEREKLLPSFFLNSFSISR